MNAAMLPSIPEHAPFSSEQRAWLNGFLAGLLSDIAQPTSIAKPASLQITIYFATQSGTAERLAKKMAKELKTQGHTVEIASIEKATPATLVEKEHAFFFASTYGEGEPPDSARTFTEALFSDSAPQLQGLRYTVFGLGDRNYEHFCKFGVDLDERLAALGATRLTARAESDVEVDESFHAWKMAVTQKLVSAPVSATAAPTPVTVTPTVAAPSPGGHSRENPYLAEVNERRPLTSNVSSKLTMHVSFSLAESSLQYEAGDACGVLPQNDPALVAETLSLVPFAGSANVEVPKVGTCTLEEALLFHFQHTRLTRKMVRVFAEKSQCKTLAGLMAPEQATHLDEYMWDRGLIDLLHEYPGVVQSPEDLVAMLPRLSPRLYSISSSPAAHGRDLHCTIAVVRFRSHNRERGGVASTMLAERVEPGQRVPIYIQPNKRFRLPMAGDTPIIMIGPGTGIAPFRSFLHERQALGQRGRNWLFFGERSASNDFLYCQELRSMCESGHLTKLDTAFSRDQARKIYVQDKMLEHSAEFWRWLEEGAQVYVCGDASRMAKDVDASLHSLIETAGGLNPEEAADYVSQLHEDGRYHRDVY